tara:strand:+ start:749 stop:2341 length:1593 start_codon:yes stop_codon:yes gene_type:complete
MYFDFLDNFKKRKEIFYLLFLSLFSIFINQYYGYIGVFPEDSFLIFNSGYDVLNGYFPFKDYYTTTGPLLDLLQAIFFKIFGVSWFSYVLHASIINFLLTTVTFYSLLKFKLNINYCFFYSILVSILAYPTSGTPFMDHHSTFLSIISLLIFILALKTKFNFYWFLLPIALGLAFLSKQVPAGYVFLIISFLSIIYFLINFDIKKIFFGILGSILFLAVFIITMKLGNISFMSFFEQYILFPQTLGKDRLEFVFPLEFKKIILRFKLIHLSLLVLVFICIKKIIENRNYIKNEEFLILISLIAAGFALILLELMTINEKFIFFIIPIFIGFSHIFYEKYFKEKKYILYFLIFLSISSTSWYLFNYVNNRSFLTLDSSKIKNAIHANILDEKLKKLKWVTVLYPDDPKKEILLLKEAIDIIKEEKRNKAIVTDYQFISILLSSYDYSPNRVWHGGANYPMKGNKYYEGYRNFFIDKLNENKIEVIYTIGPLWGEEADDVLTSINDKKCINKTVLTSTLNKYLLDNCNDLNY